MHVLIALAVTVQDFSSAVVAVFIGLAAVELALVVILLWGVAKSTERVAEK